MCLLLSVFLYFVRKTGGFSDVQQVKQYTGRFKVEPAKYPHQNVASEADQPEVTRNWSIGQSWGHVTKGQED